MNKLELLKVVCIHHYVRPRRLFCGPGRFWRLRLAAVPPSILIASGAVTSRGAAPGSTVFSPTVSTPLVFTLLGQRQAYFSFCFVVHVFFLPFATAPSHGQGLFVISEHMARPSGEGGTSGLGRGEDGSIPPLDSPLLLCMCQRGLDPAEHAVIVSTPLLRTLASVRQSCRGPRPPARAGPPPRDGRHTTSPGRPSRAGRASTGPAVLQFPEPSRRRRAGPTRRH